MHKLIALGLFFAPTALACGPYVPRPQVNAHAIVHAELPDGTAVSTTRRAGELRIVREGKPTLVQVDLWSIRDLDVVGDQLVLAGSSWGQPALLVGDGANWEHVWVEGMGEVVDVTTQAVPGGLVFAASVDGGGDGPTLAVAHWPRVERS
ncbi:MAG: hypothetical protein EP330_28630 [Deltaproteobacteria bacterium]|nr:MAG: hypothetical protein EP330_28630 [Deltaproteobacteria bacterium]